MGNREQSEQAAAAWIARRGTRGWTGADDAALDVWLAQSSSHRVAYFRLKAFRSAAMGRAPWYGCIAESMRGVLTAGVLAVAVVGAALLVFSRGGADHYTPVGGLAAVPMSDGSKVTLNTDSQLRIALTAQERRVVLHRGEAFFEVAPDPDRPFVVSVGDLDVVAIGTSFSVLREPAGLRIIVTQGRVQIERARSGRREAVAQVAAGSVARAGDGGVRVDQKTLAETEEFLNWRSGFVVFHENTLADIAAEFNRYNKRKLVIADPDIAALQLGGNFRSTNPDAFVRLLQNGLPIRAEYQGDRIILQEE